MKDFFHRDQKGFTLIELMIVIAIIGILAAIAIPNFISYRKKSYNASAQVNLTQAYSTALAYYAQVKHGGVTNFTLSDLTNEGFIQTPNVIVTVNGSSLNEFTINTKHAVGDVIYSIDASGDKSNG